MNWLIKAINTLWSSDHANFIIIGIIEMCTKSNKDYLPSVHLHSVLLVQDPLIPLGEQGQA